MKSNEIKNRTCPLCGQEYTGRPALSRNDSETLICADCGTRQALESIGISPEEQEEIISCIHKYTESVMEK